MSFTSRLKGKALVPASSIFLIFALSALAGFLPSCGRQEAGPEVISRRVKLDMPDAAGEQQPKNDLKPAVGNMPDVKADLPVKTVAKPDTAKPAIKVELPGKKEPEVVKEKDKKNLASVSGTESDRSEKKSDDTESADNGPVPGAKKNVYTKSAIKKANLRPWAVNVASFSNDGDAKKLISALRSSGYNGYVTEFTKNGTQWHRVRVGFYHTRDEALKAGKRIEAKFHGSSAWVVKPSKEETLEHIK